MNFTHFVRKILKIPFIYFTKFLAFSFRFNFPARFPWYRVLGYLFDRYEIETTRFFKKTITKGMVVVDMGASIGYFTRLFSRLVGSTGMVYAFEPDEENFKVLIKNTQHLKNVRIFKLAVSDTSGTANFYHVPNNSSLHSLVHNSDDMITRSTEQTTLDAFAARENISIDVIKIDVEGAEDRVFAGMKEVLRKNPWVVFEYIPKSSKPLLDSLSREHTLYSIAQDGTLQTIESAEYRTGRDEYTNLVLHD